jgi:hypothetical protein
MTLFYHQVDVDNREEWQDSEIDCVTDASLLPEGMIVIKQKWLEDMECPKNEGKVFLSVEDLFDIVDALSDYAKRQEDG